MKKEIYNEQGENNGLVFSVYLKSNEYGATWYCAEITDNNTDYWREIETSARNRDEFREFAKEYADGERYTIEW